MKRAALLLGVAALAACSKPAQQQTAPAASTAPIPSASAPAAAPAEPVPEAPSTSRDPAAVVVAWAKAMSLKQWGGAYRYWGDEGARSGLTLLQFTERWSRLANPEFELHPGTTEGAAGSSFYTAPIVLIDGKRHKRGGIVLRRVNDVDGATPEQLRWHIESLTVQP